MTMLRPLSPATATLLLTGALLALAGCSGTAPPKAEPIGGQRDAHGCPVAAGYTWCARERDCVRPWELAEKAGFPDTAEGFRAYCEAAPDAAPAGQG
jgi:hypothetical protein